MLTDGKVATKALVLAVSTYFSIARCQESVLYSPALSALEARLEPVHAEFSYVRMTNFRKEEERG